MSGDDPGAFEPPPDEPPPDEPPPREPPPQPPDDSIGTDEEMQAFKQAWQDSGGAYGGSAPPMPIDRATDVKGGVHNYYHTYVIGSDGKVYGRDQEPPPGPRKTLRIHIRKFRNGTWVATAEISHVTRRAKSGEAIAGMIDRIGMSGAPPGYEFKVDPTLPYSVRETLKADDFFSHQPQTLAQAIAQAIAALQIKGALHHGDDPVTGKPFVPTATLPAAPPVEDGPVDETVRDGRFTRHRKVVKGVTLEWATPTDGSEPPGDTGGGPGGIPKVPAAIAAAVVVVLLVGGLAVARAGPFAPASTAGTTPGSHDSPAATVSLPVAVAGPCGPNGNSLGPENLATSGGVATQVVTDCGAGPTGGRAQCTVQKVPFGSSQTSYVYDMYGGFYTNGTHYELHFPGSGLGPSYSVTLPVNPNASTPPNRGHVTMISYSSAFTPMSTWQSGPGGTISWTPSSVTLAGVIMAVTANSPQPASAVTLDGTWLVHGCA